MKGKWKVSHTYAGGETFIQVYRLRDLGKVDCAGNREVFGPVFSTDEEATIVADLLNEKDRLAGEKDQITSRFVSYVLNDYEATGGDSKYVADALAEAGVNESGARKIGLGFLYDVAIIRRCPICQKEYCINVSSDQYRRYESGAGLIQDIFQDLNPLEREFIKSGYCAECQKVMFGTDYSSQKIKEALF